jgi:hypothetical protein
LTVEGLLSERHSFHPGKQKSERESDLRDPVEGRIHLLGSKFLELTLQPLSHLVYMRAVGIRKRGSQSKRKDRRADIRFGMSLVGGLTGKKLLH